MGNTSTEATTAGREFHLLRVLAGLSQDELARRAQITTAHLSRIERGYRNPSPEVRARIEAALMGGATEPTP